MYAAWERIGETREGGQRGNGGAPSGAHGREEEEEEEEEEPPQRGEDGALSLSRRRLAAHLSRREKILRADQLDEEGFFEGDELDIPSEGEMEAEEEEREEEAARAGDEDGQHPDCDPSAAATPAAATASSASADADPDALSSDPDAEEDHMLELIDSTLSLALHEQGRGVTTPGPKAHIGVEQLTARRKHRVGAFFFLFICFFSERDDRSQESQASSDRLGSC